VLTRSSEPARDQGGPTARGAPRGGPIPSLLGAAGRPRWRPAARVPTGDARGGGVRGSTTSSSAWGSTNGTDGSCATAGAAGNNRWPVTGFRGALAERLCHESGSRCSCSGPTSRRGARHRRDMAPPRPALAPVHRSRRADRGGPAGPPSLSPQTPDRCNLRGRRRHPPFVASTADLRGAQRAVRRRANLLLRGTRRPMASIEWPRPSSRRPRGALARWTPRFRLSVVVVTRNEEERSRVSRGGSCGRTRSRRLYARGRKTNGGDRAEFFTDCVVVAALPGYAGAETLRWTWRPATGCCRSRPTRSSRLSSGRDRAVPSSGRPRRRLYRPRPQHFWGRWVRARGSLPPTASCGSAVAAGAGSSGARPRIRARGCGRVEPVGRPPRSTALIATQRLPVARLTATRRSPRRKRVAPGKRAGCPPFVRRPFSGVFLAMYVVQGASATAGGVPSGHAYAYYVLIRRRRSGRGLRLMARAACCRDATLRSLHLGNSLGASSRTGSSLQAFIRLLLLLRPTVNLLTDLLGHLAREKRSLSTRARWPADWLGSVSIPRARRSSSILVSDTPSCICCSRLVTPVSWLERVPTYRERTRGQQEITPPRPLTGCFC